MTTTEPRASTPVPLVVTVLEACEMTRLSRSTIYGLIQNGRLQSIKVGRCRRLPVAAIEQFLAAQGEA